MSTMNQEYDNHMDITAYATAMVCIHATNSHVGGGMREVPRNPEQALRISLWNQERAQRDLGVLRRVSRWEWPTLSDEQQKEQILARLKIYPDAERALAHCYTPYHRPYRADITIGAIMLNDYDLDGYETMQRGTEEDNPDMQDAFAAEIRLRAEGKARQVKMKEWRGLSPGVRAELLAQRLEAMGHSYPVAMELAKSAL